jgi:hypothetical protein
MRAIVTSQNILDVITTGITVIVLRFSRHFRTTSQDIIFHGKLRRRISATYVEGTSQLLCGDITADIIADITKHHRKRHKTSQFPAFERHEFHFSGPSTWPN